MGGWGALKAKRYIFVGGGGGVARLFFLQSSGQLAFVKLYNFLQVMVLLKNAVCSNGICWNEKKVPIFRRGLSKKKKKKKKEMSYARDIVVLLTDKVTL